MDTIPERSKIAVYRKLIEPLEKYLWFPVKNPHVYSLSGLLLSAFFLFIHNTLLLIMLIITILFTDWFDGAAARRYKFASKSGYIVDITVDRISEGFMFVPLLGTTLGNIFFFLLLVNILLAFYAIRSGKHFSLALRFFYLFILVFRLRFP